MAAVHPPHVLALIHRRAGRFDRAETLQVHVLECRRRLFGDAHPHTHRIVESLKDTYYKLRNKSRAKEMRTLWRALVFPDAGVEDTDIDMDFGDEVVIEIPPTYSLGFHSRIPLTIFLIFCSLFVYIVFRNLVLFTLILGFIGFTFRYRRR